MGTRSTVAASIGAGLYWGISMRNLSSWHQQGASTLASANSVAASEIACQLIIVLIGLFLILVVRKSGARLPLRLFAWVALVASVVFVVLESVLSLVPDPPEGTAISGFGILMRAIGMVGCMMLWGLKFAFLSKEEAGSSVVLVAAIGLVAYFSTLLVLPTQGSIVDFACFAISLGLFLMAECPTQGQLRQRDRSRTPSMIAFYASRIAIGLVLGLSRSLFSSNGIAQSSFPFMVAGLALSIGALVWALCRYGHDSDLRLLPLLPFAAMGFFSSLYFNGREPAYCGRRDGSRLVLLDCPLFLPALRTQGRVWDG